mgnify:CR=1 FL=1
MKLEPLLFSAASMAMAAVGGELPPDQSLFLWSVAGTVTGAAVASLGMRATSAGARLMRASVSFCAGLLIAPYAIANLPRGATTPDWWHAYAASGIGASLVYVLVSEGPALLRAWLRQRVPQSERESGRAAPRLIGWLVLAAALAHGIAACFLPAKDASLAVVPPREGAASFCDRQPASVDKIIAAQERGVMTEDEVETFFDLLWLASAKCDGADQAAIDEIKAQLEDLAQKVEAR